MKGKRRRLGMYLSPGWLNRYMTEPLMPVYTARLGRGKRSHHAYRRSVGRMDRSAR